MTNSTAASSSNSSQQQTSTDNKDKVRVLCLHGYRQNGDALKNKLGSFRKFVCKYAELVFLTAPHLAAPLDANSEPVAGQYSWWANKDDGTFKGTNKSGPAFGFQDSLRVVEEAWKTQGPFQGLLGFSQGACFVGLLCGLAKRKCKVNISREWICVNKEPEESFDLKSSKVKFEYSSGEFLIPQNAFSVTSVRPDFAIISSGFISGSLAHKSIYEESISIPTLHTYGLTDEIIPKEMSQELAAHFKDVEIIEHSGGHYFPATAQQKQTYINFFQDRLQEYLENIELQNCANATFVDAQHDEEDGNSSNGDDDSE